MIAWLASPRARRLGAPRLRWVAALGAAAALLLVLPAEGMAGAALRALGLLGALAASASALRRAPASAASPVALLDRQPLGGGAGVALVEAGGRRLLLGYGPSGVSLLGELERGGRP